MGGSRLTQSASRVFGKLVVALNAVGTALILGLAVLVNMDVFGRFVLNKPITGVPEIVQISIVAIVFLQTGHTVRVGRFIRSDALFKMLLRRRPVIARALGGFYNLTGAFLFLVIAWATAPRFVRAVEENYFIGSPGVFVAPSWPIYFIVVFCCAVTSVQFALLALADWRAMRGGPAPEYEDYTGLSE